MKQTLTAILASALLAFHASAADPLPSWTDTAPKQAIVSFVAGDWSLDSLERQIKGMTTAGEWPWCRIGTPQVARQRTAHAFDLKRIKLFQPPAPPPKSHPFAESIFPILLLASATIRP